MAESVTEPEKRPISNGKVEYDRINIKSVLYGIPRAWNPLGYNWDAPPFSLITHAMVHAHRTKPGTIELYNEEDPPRQGTSGRVHRFKVPFISITRERQVPFTRRSR